LKALEQAIDAEKDIRYKAGLARFLSEFLGIRLSPVIILSRISHDVIVPDVLKVCLIQGFIKIACLTEEVHFRGVFSKNASEG
jgi:hypothetical protein